jgi:hypothetical protein
MPSTPQKPEPPGEWLEALARSEAEAAAGKTVSGDEVLRELDESIVRLESVFHRHCRA